MAAAGVQVGTGYLPIEPDFSGFQAQVGRKLKETLTPAMRKAGRGSGKEIGKGAGETLGQSLNPLRRRFERFGSEAGEAMARGLRKRKTKAVRNAVGDSLGLDEMSGYFAQVRRGAEKNLSPIERIAGRLRGRLRGLGGDFRSVGRDLRQLGGKHLRGLAGDLGQIAGGLRRTDRSVRVTSSGFGGFDGVMARVNRGFSFFRNLLRTLKWPVLIAGLGLSVQGLSALALGAVAAASSLGSLGGALVALPAAAAVAAQAFGVLKLATAGIGDAVKSALDAEVQSGTQAVDILRQQRDAAEGVEDAKRNLSAVERQATFATEDLTRAREDATRELEDMRLASEGAADSEQQAVLQWREARQELARTLADPTASGLDVRFAEEAVDQARHGLEQTRLDAERAREDYRKAQKAGVEGMPQVVAAKRSEEDAIRAVEDAERDVRRAINDASAAMEQQGSAATALHDKMAQLPPAGQKFVRFLVSLKPRLDDLRSSAAEGFFPGAETGLKGLLGNFKVVRGAVARTSSVLGDIAEDAGERLGSAVWGRDLTRLGDLNARILERAGGAGMNFAESLRHILASAEPFLDWLSVGTLRLSQWVKGEAAAGRESGRLAGFFDRTRSTMERLGPILKGVGGALLNIGDAARPLGNEILDALGNAAEGWRRWTATVGGQNRLKRYFTETKPAIFEMGRLIRDAGKAFFELGRQRGVAHLLRLVRTELIPAMRDLVGVTTGWASSFLKDFGRLRDQGVPAFDAFLQVLAEHAAEAGVKIAKALVKAFINSDVWGKLAIGGFLFSKFGGMGAFDRFGKNAGRRFAGGFLLAVLGTELAKQVKQIIEGHKLDAPKTEEFAKYVNGLFEIDTAKIVAPNRVKISTALGKILFNAQTEKVISVSSQKLSHLVGQIPAQFVTRFNEMRRLKDAFRDNLRPLPTIAGKAGADMRRAMFPKLDELTRKGGQKADAFASRIGGAFWSVTGSATKAMDTLGFNVTQMLRTLGGKAPKFNLKKALKEMPELPSMQERKEGGFIVPGTGSGDKFRTMLPAGSFVLNREATAAYGFQKGGMMPVALEPKERVFMPPEVAKIGARNLHEANARVPRHKFQGGGIVPVPGFPGESMNSRILGPALAFMKRFNLFLTDAYGPGHQSPEHTQYGTALDIVPGPGGSWGQVGKAVAYAVQKGWNPVYYDGSYGSISLEGHGPPSAAGDNAHAHVTLLTAAELLGGKLAGAVSGGLGKLEKMTLEGPDGALKEVGQLAIDKVHKAGVAYLAQQQGVAAGMHSHSMTGGLEATGNGSGLMRKISAQRGWNFPHWWELDARETGHGADIYNESSGASLRAQFLPMNFGKYGPGSDPSQNPSMGEQIMSMARYIAERYGNPTAALAHHDANNWYQRGGMVGLQMGGLLDRFSQQLAIGGGVDLNHRFREAMYPNDEWFGLPEMSFPIAAALAEAAGKWAGTDMPGITMAQMSKGEGGLKPGSTGDDNGDGKPDGYGWLAITRPHGNSYGVTRFGGYEAMLNPVLNAAVAASMYGARGLAPWYGDDHVTSTNAHYTGNYDIRNSLGGQTFGEAIGQAKAGEGGSAGGKEDVPATFKGAKTGNLDFGPMPKTLEGVNKEIAKWQRKAPVYRTAKRDAEKAGKSKTAQLIGENLSKIEQRLAGLTKLRTRLRLDKVRKSLSKRIGKAFRRFDGYDQIIDGSQLAYEEASQYAEQVVALEPQSPELPANATDAQRQKAEADYVASFTNHVNTQERPAYSSVLERVAAWRNNILRAEKFGFGEKQPSVSGYQNRWEKEVRVGRLRIDKIKEFSEAVAKRIAEFKKNNKGAALPKGLKDQIAEREEMRRELPELKLKDTRLSGAILQARERFFPGGKNRLDELPEGKPVPLPLPGSGTLEERLREVQGIHWPEQHELLPASSLAPPRKAGRFGGVIWGLQETIEELGLKISQAANSIAGPGGGGDTGEDSELVSILREIAERERKGRFVSERLSATAAGFDAFYGNLPRFHEGGVTPGPATREFPALLKGEETVRTAEQEAALAAAIQSIPGAASGGDVLVEVNVHGTIVSDRQDPVEVVLRDPRTKEFIKRVRVGRPTAGGARSW